MYQLCAEQEVAEGAARGFEVDGVPVFVVRKFGCLYAYVNSCPHIGVPLEWLPDQFLDSEGELIQCATHGALFAIDTGLCVAGPCVGEALVPLPLVIHDGIISLTGL